MVFIKATQSSHSFDCNEVDVRSQDETAHRGCLICGNICQNSIVLHSNKQDCRLQRVQSSAHQI